MENRLNSRKPGAHFSQVFDKLYEQDRLTRSTLPYSPGSFERAQRILNFHSNYFQQIVSLTHNNFEIDLLMEEFPGGAACSIDKTLPADDVEKLFVQFIALFEISRKLTLDFIDFSRFYIAPGGAITFPVVLSKECEPELGKILAVFKEHELFKNLHERNYAKIFDDLSGKYKFDEHRSYLYHFTDFNTGVLDSYPLTRPGGSNHIKIKIKTGNIIQQRIIKINLFHSLAAADVFFISVPNESNNLLAAFPGILGEKAATAPLDFVSAIDELKLFLKKSSYESLVLLIDNLKTREDSEFIKYLFDAVGAANVLLIVFGENEFIDFDLELKERPRNRLAKYLRFYNLEEAKELSRQEIFLLKVFKAVPGPLSKKALTDVFPPDESRIIEGLVKKKYLTEAQEEISLNVNPAALNIQVSRKEEQDILKLFLDKFDSFNVMIKYFLKVGETTELKRTLKKYLQNRYKLEDAYSSTRKLFFENIDFLQKETDLIRLFIDIFIKENDLPSARELIDCCRGKDPLFLDLKLAHIFRLEKDYAAMGRILNDIAGEIPPELADEFNYLKFIDGVKTTGFKTAERYLKEIKSELYLNLADIVLSDRYIYRGEHQEAEQMLKKAIAYLGSERYFRDELDAANQLAKLFREKEEYDKAETLYKNIFLKSEINNYKLLSAHIAIDIGTLCWIRDDPGQAESWIKKALRIYSELQNRAGEILAYSNLAEINKIKGNWQETENQLKAILKYDQEMNKIDSLAVDYYNISHLEYLRHNYSRALEMIGSAISLFEKKENLVGRIESKFLEFKINALKESRKTDLAFLERSRDKLNSDQQIILAIMQEIEKKNRPIDISFFIDKIAAIKFKSVRYETLVMLIEKYRHPELLEPLRRLSMELSKETRNYYYYEYYYIYFGYFFAGKEMDSDDRAIFLDLYYFFLKNKRRISPGIAKLKNLLDEKESSYDIFKSAELVGDYYQWKIPEDFFKSLLGEIEKVVRVDLVKLLIYEIGKPLFKFANPNKYNDLADEIVTTALSRAENLDLNLEETRILLKNETKIFYFFKNTKVILWRISDSLFAVLLLAFVKDDYRDYDFYERNKELLKKFAHLIRRYYEVDYKLHSKLDFIIGESLAVKSLKENILKIGKVDFPVLISGQSGSGKELVARGIHLMSRRADQPFIPVNSAAIPEHLLEAELFGYKKGAFTGAHENRTGLLEAAARGTLFLDEIADLPIGLQAKLLRALQEQEIRRLGENNPIKVDFRLISATNKDLKTMVRENRFREDLYYRLEVLQIAVPALKDRADDIPLLTEYFLKKNNFPIKDRAELQAIAEYFKSREWPGNVRELESSIKRLITYYPDFELGEHIAYKTDAGLIAAKCNLEKSLVVKTLKENNWNKVKTAASLNISRMYLFKLIKKYNITKGE